MATPSASRTDRPTTKNDETDGRLVALVALVAGTVGAAVVFVLVEQRVAEPILPLHLFKDPTFAIATSVGLIIGVGMFAALTLLPTFLQMSTGASVAGSGFLMLPMMAGVMLTTIGSGIANLAYYLMVMGGGHPRAKTSVNVTALSATSSTSLDMAQRIWYRALTVYFTSSTNFQRPPFRYSSTAWRWASSPRPLLPCRAVLTRR